MPAGRRSPRQLFDGQTPERAPEVRSMPCPSIIRFIDNLKEIANDIGCAAFAHDYSMVSFRITPIGGESASGLWCEDPYFGFNHRWGITLLSLMPEKKQSPAIRDPAFHVFWKAGRASRDRNTRDASPTRAEENGSRLPSHTPPFSKRAHRFPTHVAADSEGSTAASADSRRNRGCAGRKDSIEAFQFR